MLGAFMDTVCPKGDGVQKHDFYVEEVIPTGSQTVEENADVQAPGTIIYKFTCNICDFTYYVPEYSLHASETRLVKQMYRILQEAKDEDDK